MTATDDRAESDRLLALGAAFLRLPRAQQLSMVGARALVPRLEIANRRSRRSVLGAVPVVVSLTTYGARLAQVHLTIESIARSRQRPRRLILWLDRDSEAEIPQQLQRLVDRGLELRRCDDLGPYKKVFPYAESEVEHAVPLVSADDDILYPQDWLAHLVAGHRDTPDTVSCYRARVIAFTDGGLAPYASWELARTTTARQHHFATAHSGVLYPPRFLDALRDAGLAFLAVSPRADDVWLHHIALQNDFAIRQLHARAREFPVIPWSQEVSLTVSNVGAGMNDTYLRQTYTADDLARIHASIDRAATG